MSKGDQMINPAHCDWCAKGRPGPKALPLSYMRLFVIVQVVFILAVGTWAGVQLAKKVSTGEPVWIAIAMGYALAMSAAMVYLVPKMVRDWRGSKREQPCDKKREQPCDKST